jgi:hypothetical protein
VNAGYEEKGQGSSLPNGVRYEYLNYGVRPFDESPTSFTKEEVGGQDFLAYHLRASGQAYPSAVRARR